MDRLRTIAKNIFYNVGGWGVSVLIKLLVIPYYIGQLSPEGYGLYAVLHSLTGYVAIMDLGLAQGVTKFVAEYNERGQDQSVAQYVANAYLIIGIIAVWVGVAIYFLRKPLADLLAQEQIGADTLEAGFLVVACTVFFALATMVGSATLKGYERYDLVNRVTIAAGIGGALAGVGLLSVGYGVVTLILVDFGVAAFSAVVLGGVALYRMDHMRLRHWWPDWQVMKDLATFGGAMSVQRLATRTSVYLPRFVVSSVVGPIGVTYFEVSAKVARALKGIHNQATHVLFPVASQLAVSSTGLNDFSASYLNFSKYVALLSAPFFAGLTFFGGDVLELWVGPDIAAHSTAVLSVLVLAYFANSFTNITNHFALGEDQYRYVVVYGSTLLFAVVASIYPLVVSFGVVGAAGSVFASRFVAALLFLGLYNRRCNIRTRTYFIEVVLLATGVSFGTAGLAYGIGAMLGAGAVVALAIAIVCMIGYFVVVWRYASIPPTLREKLVRLVSNQARAVGTGSDSS